MNMMQEATVLVPCGHAYCKKCISGQQTCPQCDKKHSASVPVKLIGDLVTKYIYKRDAISTFRNDSFWKSKATA